MTVTKKDIIDVAPDNVPQSVIDWVDEIAQLTKPERVYFADGSDAEWKKLTDEMVESGSFNCLNEEKRPNSFLARSLQSDVARVEARTYIYQKKKKTQHSTNNWAGISKQMKATLLEIFDGSMRGRTMYVVPFSNGPLGGHISKLGIEINGFTLCCGCIMKNYDTNGY